MTYGYDLYLSNLAASQLQLAFQTREHAEAVAVMMDAAWWFVGKGILRPGVRYSRLQQTDEGAAVGFSITRLGREWLSQPAAEDIPMTSPSRMKSLFLEFGAEFGHAFAQRANEAVSCYDSRNHLAACVMAGAAAESILLSLAINKTGDEDRVMTAYTGRDGRVAVRNMLVGKAKAHLQNELGQHMELLRFWRDQAAHGAPTGISEDEAYLALVGLVRFARFARNNKEALTRQEETPPAGGEA